jgi:hypothetical protein
MSCKPESQKQRLERIPVQILAGLCGNGSLTAVTTTTIRQSVEVAQELIKQLDALPLEIVCDQCPANASAVAPL